MTAPNRINHEREFETIFNQMDGWMQNVVSQIFKYFDAYLADTVDHHIYWELSANTMVEHVLQDISTNYDHF